MKNIPSYIRLDLCSMCQLKCRSCSTARGENRELAVGWGYLSIENFKKFLDDNPEVKVIEISNYGEIFLNPDLEKILAYAHEKGVVLQAKNGVNLNRASESTLKALVQYKMRVMTISLDGASQETYGQYRVTGNFDKVINNIKRINYYKKQFACQYPELNWQFILFGHSEHELPAAMDLARQLNMRFIPKVNHAPHISPVKDKEFLKKHTGLEIVSADDYQQPEGGQFFSFCPHLWEAPQINWDGKMLGCCINNWGDFGNVFEKGLGQVLNSEKYIYTKNMLLGRVGPDDDIPCAFCTIYRSRTYSGEITLEDLRSGFMSHHNQRRE